MSQDYKEKLLLGWEEVFKKSQIKLLILLALKEHPKTMREIKLFINETSNSATDVDEKSLYRALRSYNDVSMVLFTHKLGNKGPDIKIYKITETGLWVLNSFTKRNIFIFFENKRLSSLL